MQPAGDGQMLAKPPFPKERLCYVDTADCLHCLWLLAGDWPLLDAESLVAVAMELSRKCLLDSNTSAHSFITLAIWFLQVED